MVKLASHYTTETSHHHLDLVLLLLLSKASTQDALKRKEK